MKKGDLIAQIDPITQQNTLQTKQAELALNAQLANQKIQLDIASKQYKREQALLAEDASSREAVENAKDSWSAAQAALKQTQASIKQTTVLINTAEVELGYTKIIAPFTGTVVSVPVEEGQTVNANQTTPTIAEIADLSQMEVKLEIAEGDITKVKTGLPVEYTILSEPNEKFHTTLQSIDPGLTTLTDGTYSESSNSDAAVYYYAKLLVPNAEGKLRIGMTTQNVITSQEVKKHLLIVPTMAIKNQKGKRMVRVLQADGKVEEREIKVGLTDGLNTQAVSGLKEGDKVIMGSMNASEKSQAVQQGKAVVLAVAWARGSSMAMIEIKNLNRYFGEGENRVHILKDINLSVEQGDFIAIIGQSGSGKSTLMNAIGCLDTPSSGLLPSRWHRNLKHGSRRFGGFAPQKVWLYFPTLQFAVELERA